MFFKSFYEIVTQNDLVQKKYNLNSQYLQFDVGFVTGLEVVVVVVETGFGLGLDLLGGLEAPPGLANLLPKATL